MRHTYHVAVEPLCGAPEQQHKLHQQRTNTAQQVNAPVVCGEDVCDRIRQPICLCGGSDVADALVKLREPRYGKKDKQAA